MFGWNDTSFDPRTAKRVVRDDEWDLADVTFGLTSGTRVATQMGWRPVEGVTVGDQVLTFDGGLQTVVEITRKVVCADLYDTPETAWPLFVPAGALGNREDMILVPNQTVLIESDAAEDAFGDPFALIPATALVGFRGITRIVPDAQLEVITLHFAQDEIVFANIGALFHCPRTGDLVSGAMDAASQPYDVLSMDAAETLVALLEMDEASQVPACLGSEAQSTNTQSKAPLSVAA